MAWVSVDKDGSEYIFCREPYRDGNIFSPTIDDEGDLDDCFRLPKGSIKKLIGRELKWKDGPIELEDE